jgi:O-antigen ligase
VIPMSERTVPPAALRSNLSFRLSASVFRVGLFLVSFEQIRPFDLQLSDFCFFLSLVFLLACPYSRWPKQRGSGMRLATAFILSGALLSLVSASSWGGAFGPLVRFGSLFALFGPLALVHSKDMKENLLALASGIAVNSLITLLQAWSFPGVVHWMSINPSKPDLSDSGRFQGLTTHPNVLGLCTALAVLVAVGVYSFKDCKGGRIRLAFIVLACTIAALLSGSRTFLVALVPGLIILFLLSRPSISRLAVASVGVLLLWGTVAYLVPDVLASYSERASMTGEDYSPDYGRWMTAGLALVEISEKPLVGWGVDHVDDAGELLIPGTDEVAGTHVTFLRYWYGAGLMGAIGFLILFVAPTLQVIRALKRCRETWVVARLRLSMAMLVLLFIVSNVQPLFYNRFLYLPLFLLSGFAGSVLSANTPEQPV